MQTAFNTYFGFTDKPFKLKPDPRLFYRNPNYDNARHAIVNGLRQRKPLIVLTGESGTGKTTLWYKCRTALNANLRIVTFSNTPPNFERLLGHICKSLNVPVGTAEHTQSIAIIKKFLADQTQQKQMIAVLIEDAQSLDDGVLTGLLDLAKAPGIQKPLLQIILLGLPELNNKLRRINLPAEDISCSHLAPLQDAEVNAFIQHQILAAGYHGNGLFSPEAIETIVHFSKGIPRLINTLCDSALLIASGQTQQIITKTTIEEAAQRCYLNSPDHAAAGKPPQSTDSEQRQRRRQPAFAPSSSRVSQMLASRRGSDNKRRWLWVGTATTATLLLIGGAVLFYQSTADVPPIAVRPSPEAVALEAQPIQTTTIIPSDAASASPVPSRPASPEKTATAAASPAVAPQTQTITTTSEIQNVAVELPRITSIESTNTETTNTSTNALRTSPIQDSDVPHPPFRTSEESSPTVKFQPQSSGVFVEMRGSNKEVFDSEGRNKTVINRSDSDF